MGYWNEIKEVHRKMLNQISNEKIYTWTIVDAVVSVTLMVIAIIPFCIYFKNLPFNGVTILPSWYYFLTEFREIMSLLNIINN